MRIALQTILAGTLVLAMCAPKGAETHPAQGPEPAAKPAAVPTVRTGETMTATEMSCADAKRAIVTRRLVGWRGLPAPCTAQALFGVPLTEEWGIRRLGSASQSARMYLLAFDGYYRPLANVRKDAPVMFDGTNPKLDGGWSALNKDLGTPEATRDFVWGTVPMPGGERIYASRGITVFLNPENDFVLHVALYQPTKVQDYERQLRPDLAKPRPKKK